MEQVHLLIKNAKVFNSYLKKFISANVAVKEGKYYVLDKKLYNIKPNARWGTAYKQLADILKQ